MNPISTPLSTKDLEFAKPKEASSPLAISADALTEPVKPVEVPQNTATPDYAAISKAASASAMTPVKTYTTPSGAVVDTMGNIITPAPVKTGAEAQPTPSVSLTDRLKAALGIETEPKQTPLVDQYKQLRLEAGIADKQREVDDLTARIRAIEAEEEITPLKIQEEAEGRGVTKAGMAPIEIGRLRELAIRKLPLTAQLNAAQGRLQSAQDNINTLLDLQYKDEKAKLDRWNTLYDRAYDIATKEEQAELDKKKEENSQKERALDELNDTKRSFVSAAIENGDFKTAALLASASTVEEVERLATGIMAKTTAPKIIGSASSGYYQVDSEGNLTPLVGGKSDETVFTPEQKRKLIGANFSAEDIENINRDMQTYGSEAVMNNISDPAQKRVLQDILGIKSQFLTKDFFLNQFGMDKLKEAAKDAGFTKGGFLGIGVGQGGIDEYLGDLLKKVQMYRDVGYTDEEILKLMK